MELNYGTAVKLNYGTTVKLNYSETKLQFCWV